MTVLEMPRVRGRAPVAARPRRRRRPSEAGLVALGLGVLYLAAGLLLVLRYDGILEDALARVANADYVLFSRQPKVSAVGFVWTPLPSLDLLPFLWLKAVWPDLVRLGLLANVQSALAATFAVWTLHRLLAEMGLRRGPRLAVTLAFGLQPVVIFFAANGMTESIMIAVLLVAVRRLLQWVRDGDSRHLVATGLWLAVGYLVRYELVAVGVAATVLVALVGWRRERGAARARTTVLADVLLVGLPVTVAFLGWAAASWIIVGHPFEQFSSEYGNAALIAATEAGTAPRSLTPVFVVEQWLLLAPLLFPVLAVVGGQALRRRDPRVLAPLLVLGAVPLFELLAYVSGNLFGFLRYQIVVVPLLAVLVGLLLAPAVPGGGAPAERTRRRSRAAAPRLRRPSQAVALTAAALVLMLSATASSAWGLMTRPDLAQQEYQHVRPVVLGLVGAHVDGSTNGAWRADRVVADAVDRLHLADGAVLLDSAPGFAVISASRDPQQFVITSDSDFSGAVADPVGHGIGYLLVCDRPAAIDAVQRRWGDALDAGQVPWASLVRRFDETSGVGHKWALWKVRTDSSGPATAAAGPSTPGRTS